MTGISSSEESRSSVRHDWRLAWIFARRDLRRGVKELRVLLACLLLGVFALSATRSVHQAMQGGLTSDARSLLGGNVEVRRSFGPSTAEHREFLSRYGRISEIREMRAMARTVPNMAKADFQQDLWTLVELKAVDVAYPLYGTLTVDPPFAPADLFSLQEGAFGAVADPALAQKAQISLGDRVMVGQALFEIRAFLQQEPDRVSSVIAFGPRLMVSLSALDATGLLLPGSLIRTAVRIKSNADIAAKSLQARLDSAFPEDGWWVRDLDDAVPAVRQSLDNVMMFLALTGLMALVTGGIGVSNAVRIFIAERVRSIAIFKMLGAPSTLLLKIYGLHIGILAVGAIGVGAGMGAAVPFALSGFAQDVFPVRVSEGFWILPFMEASLYGVLVAALFAAWPLGACQDVTAAFLLRSRTSSQRRWPRRPLIAFCAICLACLVALVILNAERPMLAVGFVVGVGVAFLLFRVAAGAVMQAAALSVLRAHHIVRLGIANVARPGAPTVSVFISLGLGLSVLVMLAVTEANVTHQLTRTLPRIAPAFYFVDIQPDHVDPFKQSIAAVPGADIIRMAPVIRGRLVAINGQNIDVQSVDPSARWAVRRDRGLTTQARPSMDDDIVAGTWWTSETEGMPWVSVAAHVAKGLGLGVGDRVTFHVLGRTVQAQVANLRRVDWSTLSMNFAFILSPGALDGAPATWVATVRADVGREAQVEQRVLSRLPTISAIRVREALGTVEVLFRQVKHALHGMTGLVLAVGVLVLVAAVTAGHRNRVREAVILKILGAPRRTILKIWVFEYGLTGLSTGLLAAVVGTTASYVLVTMVMKMPWMLMPERAMAVVLACLVLIVSLGLGSSWSLLSARSATILRRNEVI